MDALTTQSTMLVAVLTAAGALLGGALAHWRRGTGFIAAGAVIGGVAMFILALAGALYSSTIVAMALIAFVGLLVLSLASMFT